MRLGIVQLDLTQPVDRGKQWQKICKLTKQAVEEGCELLALPEHFITGGISSPEEILQLAESLDGDTVSRAKEISDKYKIAILAGSIVEKDVDKYHNTSVLLDRGEIIGVYRKVNLAVWEREGALVAPGERNRPIPSRLGKIGILICSDIGSRKSFLNLAGSNLILIPAIILEVTQMKFMLPMYASLLDCYIAVVNAVKDGRCGHSLVIAPDRKILAEASIGETLLTIDLDMP
jgi:predicted amidohydrolase